MSVDHCHWIVPIFPDKVNTVEFVPEHTEVAPAMLPGSDVGLTVIVTAVVVAGAQTPLVTTAL